MKRRWWAREWRRPGRHVDVYASFDLDEINRPMFSLDWISDRELCLNLSWGDRYSDPVWQVDIAVRLPRRVAALLEVTNP